jgi:hypothetical protein
MKRYSGPSIYKTVIGNMMQQKAEVSNGKVQSLPN